MNLEDKVAQLCAFTNPFAESAPIVPTDVKPSQFSAKNAKEMKWQFDDRGLNFSEAEIAAALRRDTALIPAPENREYYGAHDFHYWISGYVEYLSLSRIAKKHGIAEGRIFDFGGSTGRVFRHFYFQGGWDVWSSDFKRSSVEWNLLNFPSHIRVFQGTYQATLPVDSQTFDLIIAMSVFTHIDETETNWLMELRRVLRVGGVALITIHNEATWSNMWDGLREATEKYSPELAAHTELPPGRHVSNFRTDDPYRCNVFHSDDYIMRQWSRYFEVLDILPRASDAQSIVVLRRKD